MTLNLSRYWIPKWDTRTSRDYATGATLGQGTQSLVNAPGWYTGDLTAERVFGPHKIAWGANANVYQTSTDSFATTKWDTATTPIYSTSKRIAVTSFFLARSWSPSRIRLTAK